MRRWDGAPPLLFLVRGGSAPITRRLPLLLERQRAPWPRAVPLIVRGARERVTELFVERRRSRDAGEVLAGFSARSRAEDESVHTIMSPPLAERVGPFCVPSVTVSVLPETAMLDAVPLAPAL